MNRVRSRVMASTALACAALLVISSAAMGQLPQLSKAQNDKLAADLAVLQQNGQNTFKVEMPPPSLQIRFASGMQNLTGLRIPPNLAADAQVRNPRVLGVQLDKVTQASFDLRSQVPAGTFGIRDQGSCGSCWIFGAVAALEGNLLYPRPDASANPAEQYLLNCITTQTSDGCNGGWPADTFQFLKDRGTLARTDPRMDYIGRRDPSGPSCSTTSTRYSAVRFGYVDEANPENPDPEKIKAAILKFGAVVVAVNATSNWAYYKSGVYNFNEGGQVNHAVALVGWNDADNSWILRNSWGPDWGENGYMRIRRNVNRVGFGAMWVEATSSGGGGGGGPDCKPCPCPNGAPNYSDEILRRTEDWRGTPYYWPQPASGGQQQDYSVTRRLDRIEQMLLIHNEYLRKLPK